MIEAARDIPAVATPTGLSPARRLRGEVLRFLIVGFTAVAIDFVVYRLLLLTGIDVRLAKGGSFVIGAVFAYFANRSFTFRVGPDRPRSELLRFIAVYGCAMSANVLVNFLVLAALGRTELGVDIAFVVATGLSATLNFIGLKLLVFGRSGTLADVAGTRMTDPPTDRDDAGARRLSLVIPCYNEAANLPALVQRLLACLDRNGIEVILVDNGSTDASPTVLAQLLAGQTRIRSVRVAVNQGYGFGILAGLAEAGGDILGWTHADLQTDPADVLRALACFNDDDAHGARLLVKGRRHGRPLADVVFTVGMSVFESLLMRRPLWDINAQPTLLPRASVAEWRDPPHDFALDLYAYHHALVSGLGVRRVPVLFAERLHGNSHWNVDWRAKLRFIRRTVDFSLRLRRQQRESP